jgi:hypothetical protein
MKIGIVEDSRYKFFPEIAGVVQDLVENQKGPKDCDYHAYEQWCACASEGFSKLLQGDYPEGAFERSGGLYQGLKSYIEAQVSDRSLKIGHRSPWWYRGNYILSVDRVSLAWALYELTAYFLDLGFGDEEALNLAIQVFDEDYHGF